MLLLQTLASVLEPRFEPLAESKFMSENKGELADEVKVSNWLNH